MERRDVLAKVDLGVGVPGVHPLPGGSSGAWEGSPEVDVLSRLGAPDLIKRFLQALHRGQIVVNGQADDRASPRLVLDIPKEGVVPTAELHELSVGELELLLLGVLRLRTLLQEVVVALVLSCVMISRPV